MLIRYDVDDMTRFPIATKFAGDTGLVPSTYASANHVSHGPLTKQGNKWLRWAFVEAVGARSPRRSSSPPPRRADQGAPRRTGCAGVHSTEAC